MGVVAVYRFVDGSALSYELWLEKPENEEKMNKVLVTGASGFVGMYLVERLYQAGFYVKTWSRTPLPESCLAHEQLCSDLLDLQTMKKAVQDCEVVIHSCYYGDMDNEEEHFKVNTVGSWELLKHCVQQKVRHFIFLSTYKLYNSLKTPIDSFCENSTVFAQDFYTAGKISIEGYCEAFAKRSDMKTTVLRLGSVYGLRRDWSIQQRTPYTRQLINALANEKIKVYGSSPHIWVEDVARIVEQLIEKFDSLPSSSLYNAVDLEVHWEACAQKVVSIAESDSEIISIDAPHPPTIVDGQKIRSEVYADFAGMKGFESFLVALKEQVTQKVHQDIIN